MKNSFLLSSHILDPLRQLFKASQSSKWTLSDTYVGILKLTGRLRSAFTSAGDQSTFF